MTALPVIEGRFTPLPDRQRTPAPGESVARARHDDDTYDLAFEVWSTTGAQNVQRTIDALVEHHNITIPRRTLYRWIGGERGLQWDDRLIQQRTEDLAPHVLQETALNFAELAMLTSRQALRHAKEGTLGTVSIAEINAWDRVWKAAGFTGKYMPASTISVDTGRGDVIDVNEASDDELARLASGDTRRPSHA